MSAPLEVEHGKERDKKREKIDEGERMEKS